MLYFDTTDGGLALTKWNLPGTMVRVGIHLPMRRSSWEKPARRLVLRGIRTSRRGRDFYASYESVFVFNCTGGGLEGEWVFASGLGLVQYLSPDASVA